MITRLKLTAAKSGDDLDDSLSLRLLSDVNPHFQFEIVEATLD